MEDKVKKPRKSRKKKIEEVVEIIEEKEELPKPVLISFNEWFAKQGKPSHHKVGMCAYRPTTGLRSEECWNNLFKGY